MRGPVRYLRFLLFSLLFQPFVAAKEAPPWVVYYGTNASLSAFKPYDPVVLESFAYADIQPLLKEGKEVFGYISLGEVESFRPWFDAVKKEGLLIEENPNWPGSYYVDVRSPLWGKRLVNEIIPRILKQGYTGLMLDTLDNAIALERRDPVKYKGMTKGAIQLIHLLHIHFPDTALFLNRAYALLPEIGGFLYGVLGESLYTDYDFETEEYKLNPPELYQKQVKLLQAAKKRYPSLILFSLDYWYPDQIDEIEKIYVVEEKNGFRPYVSTIELNRIIPRPKER